MNIAPFFNQILELSSCVIYINFDLQPTSLNTYHVTSASRHMTLLFFYYYFLLNQNGTFYRLLLTMTKRAPIF